MVSFAVLFLRTNGFDIATLPVFIDFISGLSFAWFLHHGNINESPLTQMKQTYLVPMLIFCLVIFGLSHFQSQGLLRNRGWEIAFLSAVWGAYELFSHLRLPRAIESVIQVSAAILLWTGAGLGVGFSTYQVLGNKVDFLLIILTAIVIGQLFALPQPTGVLNQREPSPMLTKKLLCAAALEASCFWLLRNANLVIERWVVALVSVGVCFGSGWIIEASHRKSPADHAYTPENANQIDRQLFWHMAAMLILGVVGAAVAGFDGLSFRRSILNPAPSLSSKDSHSNNGKKEEQQTYTAVYIGDKNTREIYELTKHLLPAGSQAIFESIEHCFPVFHADRPCKAQMNHLLKTSLAARYDLYVLGCDWAKALLFDGWVSNPRGVTQSTLNKLAATVKQIRDENKSVLLVGNFPYFKKSTADCLSRPFGENHCSFQSPENFKLEQGLDARLKVISKKYETSYFSALSRTCTNERCLVGAQGHSFYQPRHVRLNGSAMAFLLEKGERL